jgi:2-succinyl-5-enolpyruvyl-6-hydroxy-3-cyclohexene-1-carboxylate synthase
VRESVEKYELRPHPHRIMTATDTYMLLRALCDELARCGLEHACTSPGSRSAPLVLSLVRERRIRCWSHIDERCAGFFALGAAKASGRPVAVTCTSGTAAANLTPAVIEAHEARVPLIVLTADRPAELRDIGAGQTIDQLKLYGDNVKWFFEVGVHEATPDRLRWIRALACRAYATATIGRQGPVHLNFPLREPLVLDEPLPDDATGREHGRPWVTVDVPDAAPHFGGPHPFERAVIVAGRDEREPETGERLAAFAAKVGIPLLADPLSGARRGAAAIAHYDLLLRDPTFATEHRPRVVFRFGDLPTSKPLRAWLGGLGEAQMAIGPELSWQDPDAVVGLHVVTPVRAMLEAVAGADVIADESGWLDSWRAADAKAASVIASTVDGTQLSEPAVAARIGDWLPADATLFVASSMPVRDVESFFPVLEAPPRVLANRGANGIDGTVSTAFGVAAAGRGPVVLLIGDVALAHDIGGLLASRRLGLAVTVVVLHNDGGGIFHFLPVAGESDAFEQHVATPHGLGFQHAAELYGTGYERPDDLDALRRAIDAALPSGHSTVLEVLTDREENLALHRRVAEAVRDAIAPERER